MARKAKVSYWASRGTWEDADGTTQHGSYCITLNGQQHTLAVGPPDEPDGPTYRAACRAWLDLRDLTLAEKTGDRTTVRVVLEIFLRHVKAKRKPATYALYQKLLAAFCASGLAEQKVKELTPAAVERFIDERMEKRVVKAKNGKRQHQGWGPSTARTFLASLGAAFNWARRTKRISVNPLHGMDLPPTRSRARLCLVDGALHLRLLNICHAEMKPILNALESTGCRPGELLGATAGAWNDQLGALVYHAESRRLEGESSHKTARKETTRRIFFTGAVLVVVRELVQRYPSGPLFRLRGQPITLRKLEERFASLRRRLNVPHLTPYSYRHTYATRWLEAGGSIDDLAALLGNSPEVIRRHYAHLLDNPDRLRQLAERFGAKPVESNRADTNPPQTLPFQAAQ